MNGVLLVVDVLNDFMPDMNGSLAVPDGDAVVPVINQLMGVFSRNFAFADWHPEDHVSFDTWPVHCVGGKFGASFHPDLNKAALHLVIYKGFEQDKECYGGFGAGAIDLAAAIGDRETPIYVCGVATDYCVCATALEAVEAGFKHVYVVEDAVRGVAPETTAAAIEKMADAGILFVTSPDLLAS